MINYRDMMVSKNNGEEIFKNATEASKVLGISRSCISTACRKGSKCKGLKFEYYYGEDLPGEEWRSYEDVFVSNFGRVYKIRKSSKGYGHLDSTSYYSTLVSKKQTLVHRLVLFAFDKYSKAHVDHIDGDRSNNKLENLRWTTPQENNMNRKKPVKRKHCDSCVCNIK
jgi:hypothetical protein